MGHFWLIQINWRVKCVYYGLCGLTHLWHVSYRVAFGSTRLLSKPIKVQPKPEKTPVSSCRVCGLGQTLTPVCLAETRSNPKIWVYYCFSFIGSRVGQVFCTQLEKITYSFTHTCHLKVVMVLLLFLNFHVGRISTFYNNKY